MSTATIIAVCVLTICALPFIWLTLVVLIGVAAGIVTMILVILGGIIDGIGKVLTMVGRRRG